MFWGLRFSCFGVFLFWIFVFVFLVLRFLFWVLRFRVLGSSFSCFGVLGLRSSFSVSSFSTLPLDERGFSVYLWLVQFIRDFSKLQFSRCRKSNYRNDPLLLKDIKIGNKLYTLVKQLFKMPSACITPGIETTYTHHYQETRNSTGLLE